MSDQQLAEELHKPLIRIFKKRKVHSTFIHNVWGADLADMQLITKFNTTIRILLCFMDIFSEYPWVNSLKNKKGIEITDAFQNFFDESKRSGQSKTLAR